MRRHPNPTFACTTAVLLFAGISPCVADDDTHVVGGAYTPPGESPELPDPLDPVALEAAGVTIGEVLIKSQNVFDLDNPLEDKWLYRLANRLHIVTKPHVIESQLLFSEGDAFSTRLANESERILRRNSYLREADVVPIKVEDGVVDVEVRAIDVWTLTPDVSLGRKGGENRFGIGLLEQNLFGRGVRVGIKYKSTVDRDTLRFEYSDNDFLRDRYRLAATYSNNSDGTIKGFQFAKPFYALDRRRAGNLGYGDGMRIDRLYDRGEIVTEFNNEFDSHQAMLGWSNGLRNGWVRRLTAGVNYERNLFSGTDDLTLPVSILPEDREFLYPFVGLEFIEDDFRTTVNFDQIHRTEDRFLGTSLNLQLGYSSKSAGSTEDAWHYVAGYSNGLISTTKTSLTFSSRLKGRWSDGDAQDAALSAIARFHRRLSVNQLFYAAVSGTAARNLDIDNPLYLGGETGLRGYPLRYQNGESKALITLEHRLYSNWYPFRLVHIGAAIFFDAGRVWGDSPVDAENLGLLRDIGFGLRLGNSRSGNGKIIHIDIAFPLDGEDDIDSVQILIDAKASF